MNNSQGLQLDTSFDFNHIIWISSLPPDEQSFFSKISKDVRDKANSIPLIFEAPEVRSAEGLVSLLDEIAERTSSTDKFFIHLDMHGSRTNDLKIFPSEEFVSWNDLIERLRNINVASRNDLCVVGNTCYGLQMIIDTLELKKPAPFFILLAPEEEVNFGFIEDHMTKFYIDLLEKAAIDQPFLDNLSSRFKQFHCQEVLVDAFAKYLQRVANTERQEELLAKFLKENSEADVPSEALRILEQTISEENIPSDKLLKKFTSTFLIGKPLSVTFDDILKYCEPFEEG